MKSIVKHKSKTCKKNPVKRRIKDDDPKYLIWQGMKIKNGCFAKTITTKD